MSKALASSRMTPPAIRYPMATSTADAAQMASPKIVRVFGVKPRMRRNGTRRRAPARTHSWNLAVNTGRHHVHAGPGPRRVVHLEHLVGHVAPVVAMRGAQGVGAHRARQVVVVEHGLERLRPDPRLSGRHQ